MKTTPDNYTSEEYDGGQEQAPFAAALAGMIVFSQKHQSFNFPNPERLGCPPLKTLQALIASGKLPGPELRSHLRGCSECFRSYRDTLAAHKIQMDSLVILGWREMIMALLLPKQRWAFAGVLSVLLILLTGWESMHRPQTTPSEQRRAAHSLPATQEAVPATEEYPQTPEQQRSIAEAHRYAEDDSRRTARAAKSNEAHAQRKASDIKQSDAEGPETVTNTKTVTPPPSVTPFNQISEPGMLGSDKRDETGGGGVNPKRPLEHELYNC
jgi:hypothetical protein